MTAPKFGLQFIIVDDQPQPVIGANMDVIGIVGPCSTASNSRFPYDTPVLAYSNDSTLFNDLGPDGYLLDAIDGINDQLADFEIAAQLVIVRTRYGTDANANIKLAQTIANIMGNSVASTGVHALLRAPNLLFCTPRLIVCPGYTGQQANSLDTLTTNIDGVGYTPGQTYQVTFAQGAGETNGAYLIMPVAHAVADVNGNITDTEMFIDSYGAYFNVAPTATLPAPDGPPVTALAASGSITFSSNPGVGATITLNATVWTFVSGAPVGNQTQLGANLSATLTSLVTNLNASADVQVSKCTYSISQGTLLIVDDTAGSVGNNFTLAATVTGASLSGTHLSGGRDAVASTQATLQTALSVGANPVCVELPGVLDQLIGYAFVESAGTSQISDELWRNTMNSRRIVPLSGGCRVIDQASGLVVSRPLAPRMVGMQVARDHEIGAPGHSIANRPIQGIVAPGRTIVFSLTDGACEGQQLLGANIGITVRGNVGVETAISSGGFIGIVLDNAGDDTLWQMYSVCRMRDFIHLSLMPALRTYLGRTNITKQTIINVLSTIGDFLGNAKAREWIIDYRMNFKGNLNSASEIRLGHLTVGFQAEEPPITERITTMSARYKPAIDHMVQQLEQQLNIAA